MICWLTRRRLGAFQDGELGPAARLRTAAHLERCPDCAAELAELARLRAALTVEAPEPPQAVWDAFWPQVRARMAAAREPASRRGWEAIFAAPRFVLASAAAAALALIAVLAPWQRAPVSEGPRVAGSLAPSAPSEGRVTRAVVVQSVETAVPDSSVMVFMNPETEVTVVWVFGLERTGI